jgi:hypothetical protein
MPFMNKSASAASEYVDHLLASDPAFRRRLRRLRRQQQRLRSAIAPPHFELYLHLEETMNEFWLALIKRVEAWARRRRTPSRTWRRGRRAE